MNLDPFVALWSMCNALRRDRLPERRVVIRFDFTGRGAPSDAAPPPMGDVVIDL